MSFHLKHLSDSDPFERQRRIEWWDQSTLRNAKIMVVGAGALGNESLKNLALLGVGGLLILDFDTIAGSNLSRTVLFRQSDVGKEKAVVAAAATRDMALEPSVKVEYFSGDMVWDLGLGAFRRMDIVLGCVDNDEARLAINRACRSTGRPWVNGGIHGFSGNIVFYGTQGACFECNITNDQIADARSRYDSCENVKKRHLEQEHMPTIQVTSALVSALQVQEAIKYLHGQDVSIGKRLYFNGLTNSFSIIQLQENPECLAHGSFSEIVELKASCHSSLHDLLEEMESYFDGSFTISLGRRFLVEIACRNCGEKIVLMRPAHRIYDDELYCSACRSDTLTARTRFENYSAKRNNDPYITAFSQIQSDLKDSLREMTLWELGLPPLHIFTASDSNKSLTFELTGDCKEVLGSLA